MNFLSAKWANLVMANYPVKPELLQPYLPYGTELDLFRGRPYVSLVGFMFLRSKLFGVPIPWVGSFEEINLRLYVTRKDGHRLKRGVVFINETVPHRAVAWVARGLYKENYTAVPVRHDWNISATQKRIEYSWDLKGSGNRIFVEASTEQQEIRPLSFEEYIFEHYYGYTRLSATKTSEFRIAHPRWTVNPVLDHKIDVDFGTIFGPAMSGLTTKRPESVMLAEGSEVTIQWERVAIRKPLEKILSG